VGQKWGKKGNISRLMKYMMSDILKQTGYGAGSFYGIIAQLLRHNPFKGGGI
jgi:hypothetical protein